MGKFCQRNILALKNTGKARQGLLLLWTACSRNILTACSRNILTACSRNILALKNTGKARQGLLLLWTACSRNILTACSRNILTACSRNILALKNTGKARQGLLLLWTACSRNILALKNTGKARPGLLLLWTACQRNILALKNTGKARQGLLLLWTACRFRFVRAKIWRGWKTIPSSSAKCKLSIDEKLASSDWFKRGQSWRLGVLFTPVAENSGCPMPLLTQFSRTRDSFYSSSSRSARIREAFDQNLTNIHIHTRRWEQTGSIRPFECAVASGCAITNSRIFCISPFALF